MNCSLSSRHMKNKNGFSGLRQMTGSSSLCSVFEQLTVGHRRHFIKLLLPTFMVIEIYIVLNGGYQAVVILKVAKVVHLF